MDAHVRSVRVEEKVVRVVAIVLSGRPIGADAAARSRQEDSLAFPNATH